MTICSKCGEPVLVGHTHICEQPDAHAELAKLKNPATAFCDNQRLWDLLRLVRHDLFNQNAITAEEFATLVQEHPAVKRLESYDAARAELAASHERIAELERGIQERDAALDAIQNTSAQLFELLREHWKAPAETNALTLYAVSFAAGFAKAWKENPPPNGIVWSGTFPEIGKVEISLRKSDGKTPAEAIKELERQLAEVITREEQNDRD